MRPREFERQMSIFSIGDCPVCFGNGGVFCLKRADTGSLVFYCPMCGVAWKRPPEGRIDEINLLEQVAPFGAEIANEADLRLGNIVFQTDAEDLEDLMEMVRKDLNDLRKRLPS